MCLIHDREEGLLDDPKQFLSSLARWADRTIAIT